MTALEKAAAKPVEILSKWIGYREKNSPYNLDDKTANAGSKNYTRFAAYFDNLYENGIHFYNGKKQGQPWCDMTVDWAICQAYGPEMALKILRTPSGQTQWAGVKLSANLFKAANAFIEGNERNGIPKVGDQIFLNGYNHTGIISKVTSTTIQTIEGNTDNAILTRVYSRYSNSIDGYGRPNYELVADQFNNSQENNNFIIPTIEVTSPKYYLSNEEILNQKNYINNLVFTLEQARLNYNNGIIDENELKKAEQKFNSEKEKYNTYYNQIINKVENIQEILSILNVLNNATFTPASTLSYIQNKGTSQWFTKFNKQYDSFIQEFFDHITNLYQLYFAQAQNTLNLTISKISFTPLISAPYNLTDNIVYLWQKMFEGNKNINTFLNKYKNVDGYIDYDAACYNGYQAILSYYDEIIAQNKYDINNGSIEANIDIIIQSFLNILQAKIYQLYATTYGKIEKQNINDKIVYIKTGVSYDFGEENTDYQIFYQTGRETIFNNKLYLGEIDFSNIIECIQEIVNITNQLQEDRIFAANSLFTADNSYQDTISALYEQAKIASSNGLGLPVNWRELIYQMAKDYYNYANNPNYDYEFILQQNNSDILYENNTTGYEVFYTDLLGLWRYLYYNPLLEKIDYSIEENTGYSLSYVDFSPTTNWINLLYTAPSKLNFWFDLTEGSGEISNYQIAVVGDRLKAVKDNKITSLYSKEIPNIIFYEQDDTISLTENYGSASYSYFQIGGPMTNSYTISAQGRSAIDILQELLYKFIYCVENITITSLPIYILRPNYRIVIYSHISGLSGEYIVSKYSIPLTYNGTMSITATRAIPYMGING